MTPRACARLGGGVPARGAALAYYLIKVVVPPPQSAFPTDLPAPTVTLSVLGAALVLLLASFWLWRRGAPLLLLCLGWVLLTVPLPLVAAARMIAKTPVAERSLYVPSVGLCILAGGLFCAGWARRMWRGPALVLTLALVGAYATWTYGRGQVWQDNVALWRDVTSHNPASGTPYHELGQAYYKNGQNAKAAECFDKAIERYPSAEGRSLAWNSKGVVLMSTNPAQAELAFQKSIQERPTYATPYFNQGLMRMNRATARVFGDAAVQHATARRRPGLFCGGDPIQPTLHLGLPGTGQVPSRAAVCSMQAGDREQGRAAFLDARTNFEKVCKSDPYSVHAKEAAATLVEVNKQLEKLGP